MRQTFANLKNRLPIPVGIGSFITGLALSFWITALWQGNASLVYPVGRLKFTLLLALPVTAAVLALVYRYYPQARPAIDRRGAIRAGLAAGLAAAVVCWFWPAPLPVAQTSQVLELRSTQQKNSSSSGAILEIRAVRGLDGAEIPLERFKLSGDWQLQNGRLVSEGQQPNSVATYAGPLGGGAELLVRYNLDAGVLTYSLDGRLSMVDLYSDRPISYPVTTGRVVWQNAAWIQKALSALAWLLQWLGLAGLGLLVWMLASADRRVATVAVLALFGLIFWGYLGVKLSYQEFNAGRAFRDTYSYVLTAEQPLQSRTFWFSPRTFPVPLMYKLLGMNTGNYTAADNLRAVGQAQLWLSVVCWTALALALAAVIRTTWLKPLAFGLVLFFSLSLDVSLWDSLLLSESVSFSFFALQLAAWIGMGLLPTRLRRGPLGWLAFLLLLAITGLYAFTRDSNVYFVVLGAGVLLLAALFRKLPERLSPATAWVYIACVAALFLFQNATLQYGDRWTLHIYDNLALRVLPDPQARQYFAEAGLPVTPELMAITGMIGYEYHEYLDNDPNMAPVRAWIAAKGPATLIRYLITHPARTFFDPLWQAGPLLDGSNLEYRYPNHPKEPVPAAIAGWTDRFYPHGPLNLVLLGTLVAACLVLEWRDPAYHAGTLWIWAAIAVSLYPLMVLIWNGNPLEIERHAAQLGVQLRLAGLAAGALLLDRLRGFQARSLE